MGFDKIQVLEQSRPRSNGEIKGNLKMDTEALISTLKKENKLLRQQRDYGIEKYQSLMEQVRNLNQFVYWLDTQPCVYEHFNKGKS